MQDDSDSEMFDEESEFSELLSDLEHMRIPESSRTVWYFVETKVLLSLQ